MDKKQLRSIGHHLKPVVTIAGAGLSETVLAETERALHDHELIKIKVALDDREERARLMKDLCAKTSSDSVQVIGKVMLLIRKSSHPNPKLSNLIRHLNKL